MNDLEYCWETLPKVSRSFALCIPVLPGVTKDHACVSYLIFRIIDSIEDSGEKSIETKRKQLNEFKSILLEKRLEERVQDIEDFTESINQAILDESEADIIRNIPKIIRPFSYMPEEIKDSIKKWASEMIKGMGSFLGREIKTFHEQYKYCSYVAGTVGKMLTEIYYINNHLTAEEFENIIVLANNFGLGLQKTNIIKNVRIDFEQGRRYWPSCLLDKLGISYDGLFSEENLKDSSIILERLIKNAQQHLNKALKYPLGISRDQRELRNFCLIPLYMAVATLSKCYNNPNILFSENDVKITGDQVREILKNSSEYSQDDTKIKDYFRELREF